MLPIEEGFSFGSEATAAARVGSVCLDEKSRPGIRQAFFEGKGSILIDMDMRLRCLSRNLTLKLEVLFSSFSSLQIIGGTIQFTSTSASLLEDEENEDYGTNNEDRVVGGGVLT